MRLNPRFDARSLATIFIALGLAGATAQASAQTTKPHHRHHHPVMIYSDQPPLNVNKRSWLDPGNQVPVGSSMEQNYVEDSTFFARTPDQVNDPSRFHEDALPRPLYVPGGDMRPLATFASPRDPLGPP